MTNIKKANKTIKVNYSIIEAGKQMPIAYTENGKVRTIFRTVKNDSKGFYVMMSKERQYIVKSKVAFKGITTVIIEGTNSIVHSATKAPKKSTKAPKEKATTKPANKEPKQPKELKQPKEVVIIPDLLPALDIPNLNKPFLSDAQLSTISSLFNSVIKGATYKGKHIAGWASFTGEKLDKKRVQFEQVTTIYNNAENLQGVQCAIVLLMEDVIKGMAWKMVNYGAGYKTREKRTSEELENIMSYQKASSNNGKITFFDEEVIYNELVVSAYTRLFDENMFECVPNVFTSIFYRLSNVVRTEIRRNAKFKASMGHDDIVLEIDRQGSFSIEYFNDIVEVAKEAVKLTDDETKLLKLRIAGYSKKEINDMTKKRNDRTFNSYESKLEKRAGMSIKQVKTMIKDEQEALAKAKAEMKARQAQAKIASGQSVPAFENTMLNTEKSLPNANVNMIDEHARMAKFK